VARVFSARIDPLLYKLSGGRLTSAGPQVIPQLILTSVGRKSGKMRTVQLACLAKDGVHYIVGSNFGRENHPAWSYNLIAEPKATIQVGSTVIPVTAVRLSDEERDAMWAELDEVVPQFAAYRPRTDRSIRVFRLEPRDGTPPTDIE